MKTRVKHAIKKVGKFLRLAIPLILLKIIELGVDLGGELFTLAREIYKE